MQLAKKFGLGVVLMVLAAASTAHAQGVLTDARRAVVVPPEPVGESAPAWGPSATSLFVVSAWAFQTLSGGPLSQSFAGRFDPLAGEVEAPFHLPTGAVITGIQIVACDESATDQILFGLGATPISGGFALLSPIGTTGGAASPGCAVFTQALAIPHTVDNSANSYFMASAGGATSSTRVMAARVQYKLQVSPAPGTATFADVPVGTPFHRFVEALVASGITGGCGGGNYCPETPVTRGQMAVFIAAALGLHFPN